LTHPRPIIVQKYGGSSVADVPALQRVAAAVVARARQGQSLVVVVSAMGRATDELLALGQQIAQAHALPRRELDLLLTAGERISMALLSMAICALGERAQSFTGSQSGIITEARHGGARILEVRPQRLLQALEAGAVVICAGYQGVSTTREVTTLGRGGSDLTAVALAAALGAAACEIYSDVDGVYEADPRLCPQAKLLAAVPYEPMAALAAGGARVLHADAVRFAQAADIQVVCRAAPGSGSGAAPASGSRTAIDARPLVRPGPLGITHVCEGWQIDGDVAAIWPTLQDLPCLGPSPEVLVQSPTCVLMHRVADPAGLRAALEATPSATHACRLVARGILTLVGSDLLRTALPQLPACVAAWRAGAAAAAGRSPSDVAWFATAGVIYLICPPAQATDLLVYLHGAFFNRAAHAPGPRPT
jgi:acetylglutamate kinase